MIVEYLTQFFRKYHGDTYSGGIITYIILFYWYLWSSCFIKKNCVS